MYFCVIILNALTVLVSGQQGQADGQRFVLSDSNGQPLDMSQFTMVPTFMGPFPVLSSRLQNNGRLINSRQTSGGPAPHRWLPPVSSANRFHSGIRSNGFSNQQQQSSLSLIPVFNPQNPGRPTTFNFAGQPNGVLQFHNHNGEQHPQNQLPGAPANGFFPDPPPVPSAQFSGHLHRPPIVTPPTTRLVFQQPANSPGFQNPQTTTPFFFENREPLGVHPASVETDSGSQPVPVRNQFPNNNHFFIPPRPVFPQNQPTTATISEFSHTTGNTPFKFFQPNDNQFNHNANQFNENTNQFNENTNQFNENVNQFRQNTNQFNQPSIGANNFNFPPRNHTSDFNSGVSVHIQETPVNHQPILHDDPNFLNTPLPVVEKAIAFTQHLNNQPNNQHGLNLQHPVTETNLKPQLPVKDSITNTQFLIKEQHLNSQLPDREQNIHTQLPIREQNIHPQLSVREQNIHPQLPIREPNIHPHIPNREQNLHPHIPNREQNIHPQLSVIEQNVNSQFPLQEQNRNAQHPVRGQDADSQFPVKEPTQFPVVEQLLTSTQSSSEILAEVNQFSEMLRVQATPSTSRNPSEFNPTDFPIRSFLGSHEDQLSRPTSSTPLPPPPPVQRPFSSTTRAPKRARTRARTHRVRTTTVPTLTSLELQEIHAQDSTFFDELQPVAQFDLPPPSIPSAPPKTMSTSLRSQSPAPKLQTEATTCDPAVCQLPSCFCGGSKLIPGGLSPSEVPQMVLLTFDDSVNDINYNFYTSVLKNRVNPNGCPIAATFYVSHEWTDYAKVNRLYNSGHEIASHSISHSDGATFTKDRWTKEIDGQRRILSALGGIKLSDIKGMRSPFLQGGGNRQFRMLYDANITYDASIPSHASTWPYTLDYRMPHECGIPPCPTRSFPGVWEIPMVMWEDLTKGRCAMADACTNPTDSRGVYDMLVKNFKRHYTGSRTPFGMYYHYAWFTHTHHKDGFIAFLDALAQLPDVYFVTSSQLIDWMRQPTPLANIKDFRSWQCEQQTGRAVAQPTCAKAKSCRYRFKGDERNIPTCQSCPEKYPWLETYHTLPIVTN